MYYDYFCDIKGKGEDFTKESTDITKKENIINNFVIINLESYMEQENVIKETN